jgi:predicted ThiF/HesA family dinucleotide-utilizing enzyme
VIIVDIEAMENQMVPHGRVILAGVGRLGIRLGINLLQIHRGGPRTITAVDGQKISGSDVIFHMLGGENGQYKVDLLSKLSTHPEDYRVVEPVKENLNPENMDIINGDVVSIQIAGGNTIPTTAAIIMKAHESGAKTISTAGVFGVNETVSAVDISRADEENPIVAELKRYGVEENHTIVTTGRFIRDRLPITPYTLDEIARVLTVEILKTL